jgi:hypothetical protein
MPAPSPDDIRWDSLWTGKTNNIDEEGSNCDCNDNNFDEEGSNCDCNDNNNTNNSCSNSYSTTLKHNSHIKQNTALKHITT